MSERTLQETLKEYMEYLKAQGKTERTIYTYNKDGQQITSFFGTDRKLTSILTPHVGKFLKSDVLLKLPNGQNRAELTIKKTVRVLRMFFVWANERGYIANLPLPKNLNAAEVKD